MESEFISGSGGFLQQLIDFTSQNPLIISWQLFLNGGWVVFLIVFIYGLYTVWLDNRQGQFASKWKFVLLAVNIPKLNEQTPKAVENIFAALHGAQSNPNFVDKYWTGKVQESFSFEIVSLGGSIQFLIRTPVHFRDLVEAAVYAQYPEAEISEVDDYTKEFSEVNFPNEKYNLWGTEMLLVKDYPYPIRTYSEFEHGLSQSFLDPMAGLLEILSRFTPEEHLWLQLVITPIKAPGWDEKAKKVVKEMMGQDYKPPKTTMDKLVNDPMLSMANTVGGFFGMSEAEKKKEEDQWKMFKMSPHDRVVLEKVQNKLAKHAFRVKIRLIYIADKGSFAKGKGVAAVMGAIQQYNTTDANGFKPGGNTKTAVDYFRVNTRVAKRQNRILNNYVKRSNYYGESVDNMLMNPEELASVWHFPVISVKATAIDKIGSKKSAPPSRLPYQGAQPAPEVKEIAPVASPVIEKPYAIPPQLPTVEASFLPPQQEEAAPEKIKGEPPANLPFV